MIPTQVTAILQPPLPPCPRRCLAACAASSVTVASTHAATCALTCASIHWTNPLHVASATGASASHLHCATMCACTPGSAPTNATCARALTHSWQDFVHTRRAQGTGQQAPIRKAGSHLLLLHHRWPPWHRRCHWCTTLPPWCSEECRDTWLDTYEMSVEHRFKQCCTFALPPQTLCITKSHTINALYNLGYDLDHYILDI